MDGNAELQDFAKTLEAACLETLESGVMTRDLCGLAEESPPTPVTSEEFIKAIRQNLEAKLGGLRAETGGKKGEIPPGKARSMIKPEGTRPSRFYREGR